MPNHDSEIAAFHTGHLKRGNKGRFCCSRAFKCNHDNSSWLKKGVVLELASVLSKKMIVLKLKYHLSSCCEEMSMLTPHFKWFYLLIIGSRKTYFKEKKSWIVKVVVFTYK